ncbi:MAG: PQQ-binding-like beta-propeller repeat protein [Candidatus Micrarchaeia archaeon]
MKAGKFLLFFLLISVFSVYSWETLVDSQIETTPKIFVNSIIFGTYGGSIYSLNVETGRQNWRENLGGPVAHIEIIENKIFAILENGTIYTLRDDGKIQNSFDLGAYVFGAKRNDENIFISTKNGIFSFNGKEIKSIYNESGIYTAPDIYFGNIIAGKDEKIIFINSDGKLLWDVKLGPFWKSDPKTYAGSIYIGSMNHFIYSVNIQSEEKLWMQGTEGAITSTAEIYGSTVYIGSNDGYLYAIDSSTGQLRWKSKTNGAIFSTPQIVEIGKQNIVLVGSSDSYLYGFDRNTGELVWGYPVVKPINEIIYHQNHIFVVAKDYLYSISSQRSCIFTEPSERTKIGYKEVELKGKVFSEYENPVAKIRINSGPWININSVNNSFEYIFDPSFYSFGAVEIECSVTDAYGESDSTTKLYLLRTPDSVKPEFKLEYPYSIKEGASAIIYVYDAETGDRVKNFNYILNGKTYSGSEFIKIDAATEGKIELSLSKIGYGTKKIEIFVEKDWTLFIIAGSIFLIVLVAIWLKFFRKKKYESE